MRRWWSPSSRFDPDGVFVGVDGPEDEGRTLLVERLLASNRSRALAVARFEESPEVAEATRVDDGDATTRRYREAGAWCTSLIRYPPGGGWDAVELFLGHAPLHLATEGVVAEGPVLDRVDPHLAVYVLRPLAEDEPLLRRRPKEAVRIPFSTYIRGRMGLAPEPDPEETAAEAEAPPTAPDAADGEEEAVDEAEPLRSLELSDEEAARLEEWIERGVPVYHDRWALPDRHRGLASARLVVIHQAAGSGGEERARELAGEIPRIWDDEEVRHHVGAHAAPRRGQRVRVADLADPSHPETRKVVARIKRVIDGR